MQGAKDTREAEVWGAWLSYRQAGVYLGGLSRDTLRRRIEAGDIRAARLGKTVRIERASLDAYMESQTWQPETGEE